MSRKCVYVAGPYSADNILKGLANMRHGIKESVRVLKAGYAPFCPWLDYQFSLVEPITIEEYYDYSMAHLEKSDAVLMLAGWDRSKGSCAERAGALALGIPIFYSLAELQEELPCHT